MINKFIKDFKHGEIVYISTSGSKLVGTNTKNSDTDYFGIFIPTKISILLKEDISVFTNNNNNKKNSKDDIDITIYSIHRFFNLLLKSETNAIDLLFSMFNNNNIIMSNNKFLNLLKENYKYFLNKNMKSFIGYSLNHTKKFGIKGERYKELSVFIKLIETIKTEKLSFKFIKSLIKTRNFNYIKFNKSEEYIFILGKQFSENIKTEYFKERLNILFKQFGDRTKKASLSDTDFKSLYHTLRIAYQAEELLLSNFIYFPSKKKDKLKEVKEGKISAEIIITEVEEILKRVDKLIITSKLPEFGNKNKTDKLLLELIDL